MDADVSASGFDLVERPLAQAGEQLGDAVGLRPEQHFRGALNPAGRAARLGIREGFDLSIYELDVRGQPAVSSTTQPCLAIVVLLSGSGHGYVGHADGALPPIPYRAGHIYVSLARKEVTGRSSADTAEPFRLVELRLSLDFLERAGMLDVFASAGASHGLHYASDERIWLGMAPAAQTVLTDAETIFQDGLAGHGGDMRMEARALTLFDTVVGIMRNADSRFRTGLRLRDVARLDAVRATMRDDLAHPWTIAELARTAGINGKRLKETYRARFGRPVGADLQAMRLEHGRALLRSGVSVTEASLAVGYANPSHFARLFRRNYGISPRECR